MHFFDSYAIIELFDGNPNYRKYAEEPLVTSVMNLAEVHYYYLKYGNEKGFFRLLSGMPLELLEISPRIVYNAMRFRYEHRKKKLSMIDCVGYSLAQTNNFVFLTGDKEFKDHPNVEWVP